MSPFRNLVADVFQQTQSGLLGWEQLSRTAYSELILNSQQVIRLYASRFTRNGEVYRLLLVEKKAEEPGIFTNAYERRKLELLVVQDDKLIANVGEFYLANADLFQLLGAVESLNDKMSGLFGPQVRTA